MLTLQTVETLPHAAQPPAHPPTPAPHPLLSSRALQGRAQRARGRSLPRRGERGAGGPFLFVGLFCWRGRPRQRQGEPWRRVRRSWSGARRCCSRGGSAGRRAASEARAAPARGRPRRRRVPHCSRGGMGARTQLSRTEPNLAEVRRTHSVPRPSHARSGAFFFLPAQRRWPGGLAPVCAPRDGAGHARGPISTPSTRRGVLRPARRCTARGHVGEGVTPPPGKHGRGGRGRGRGGRRQRLA